MSEEIKKPKAKPEDAKQKPKQEKPKAPKVDFKKKVKELEEYAKTLETKITMLELEAKKNIFDFQEKAKGFASKAQEKVAELKTALNTKAEDVKNEVKRYGAQSLLENILDPISNIKIAVDSGKSLDDPGVKAYVQGFDMLLGQLFDQLDDYGLKRISPKVGSDFDPVLHEAISTKEDEKKNIILELKKDGYKLHDRVLKPAVVVISK